MPVAAGLYYFSHEEDNYSRPPVILIHGAGGTHLHWPPQTRRMTGQRVFAPDLPGHGKSEGVGHQSVGDYAEAVVQFMDAARLNAAVMVGHSMGSAIALTLALDFPDCVLGLGLVGSGARLRVLPAILDGTADPSAFDATVKTINDLSYGPRVKPRTKELAALRMAETRPSVLHGDFVACNEFDVMDRLGELSIPALVLCGAEDNMAPPRYSEYLRDHIRAARLRTFDGVGHMLMLEQPDAFTEALTGFLNEIPYRMGQ
ncbi:MAG: alpha/beta fold hydrolase [Chloroflexota bacterium]